MKNSEQSVFPKKELSSQKFFTKEEEEIINKYNKLFRESSEEENGLTKREYTAIKAMQGIISSHTLNLSIEEAQIIAGQSIQFADELLKQLELSQTKND